MGIIEGNPAKGIRKSAPQPRDRRLSEKEIIHLGKSITLSEAEGESPTGLAVIKLILLTGFRRNEALSLEISWLDGGLRCVRFPDTKTGRQTRMIGKAAAQLIKSQCLHSKSLFVFPADIGEGHFIGAPRVMQRLMRKAGFSEISLHTLRHTFASIGGELGFSELTLAGLLGHASRGVTQRYIHLDEALVVAADRISERIALLLETGRREARIHKPNSPNPKLMRSRAWRLPKM
jgi:integrase